MGKHKLTLNSLEEQTNRAVPKPRGFGTAVIKIANHKSEKCMLGKFKDSFQCVVWGVSIQVKLHKL